MTSAPDVRAVRAAFAMGGYKAAMIVLKRFRPGLPDHVARGALAQIMATPLNEKTVSPDKPKDS